MNQSKQKEEWAADVPKAQSHKNEQKGKVDATKPGQGSNYWDRVSEDPAKGYKSKDDPDKLLNVDQQPGDDEFGDEPVSQC